MKLATLLYIKNDRGEYLLMERSREPNKKLMSPPGGKLHMDEAETPAQCAVREAYEECRLKSIESDWKLKGILTEKDFPMVGNIMIFLMEYKKTVNQLPEPCNEGAFHFIHPENFDKIEIPYTDKLFIWKNILNNHLEPFMLSLDCKEYPNVTEIKN